MHSRQVSAQIDTYLGHIASQLARLPAEQRDEQVGELRQHLEALIAQYEEFGVLPGDAVEEALGQFGDPTRLGRRLLREWRLTERHLIRERHAPARYALKALIWTSVFCFWFCDPLLARLHSTWFPGDFSLICFVPVFAGVLTGWRWPERPLAAMLRAMFVLVRPIFICLGILVLIATVMDGRLNLRTLGPFLLCFLRWLGLWVPLGLLAAFLGSMAKRRIYNPKPLRRV